jgi:hypothetical protein
LSVGHLAHAKWPLERITNGHPVKRVTGQWRGTAGEKQN